MKTHYGELGSPGGSDDKESACNEGDWGLIPGLGISPGEGHGYPLGVLAWRIPWTEEPGGLRSMGSQRGGHNQVTNTFTFTMVSYSGHTHNFVTLSKMLFVSHPS